MISTQEVAGVLLVLTANAIPPATMLVGLRVRVWKGQPFPRPFYWAVGLFLLQVACGAYGLLWEADLVETTHHALAFSQLPAGAGVRILHLSDLHLEPTVGCRIRLEKARRAAAEGDPDLILITGDYLNGPDGKDLLASFVADLRQIAPIVGIRGNWDYGIRDPRAIIETGGATFLDGKTMTVRIASLTIGIAGANFWNPDGLPHLVQEVASADLKIILCHTPDQMEAARDLGADLYLCGHTHGGQIRLPWYGAVVTLTRTGKRFESGLYNLDKLVGYTSRGLGMEGGRAPRIRFLCRPEVGLFDIHPGPADRSR